MSDLKRVFVERGFQAQKADSPDFQCFDEPNRLISTLNLKTTTSGGFVHFLVSKWTPIAEDWDENWIDSRRLKIVLTLQMGIPKELGKNEDFEIVSDAWEVVRKLAKSIDDEVPIEGFSFFPESYRRWIWRFNHRYMKKNHKDFIEYIGLNRATTLDYLNLQALGCKDYQAIIAKEVNAKPLAIRDRIAYARRHGWIDSVKQGTRTSQMTKLGKKK
jgi:hypothetical protein